MSPSARGSRAGKRRPASRGTTSRRPPVSATMHAQPLAIDSSATRPNGSDPVGIIDRSGLGRARHNEQGGNPAEGVQDFVPEPAHERAVAHEPESLGLLDELALVRAAAGDEEAHAAEALDDAVGPAERVERELEALLVDEAADEQHEALAGSGELRAQ